MTKQQISLPYSRLLNNYKLETLILYTTFEFQNMMPVQISEWFLNPNPTNCCTALNQKSSLHFGLIMRSSIYIAFQQAQLFGGIHEYLGSRASKAGEKNGRQDTHGWPKQASLLKGYYLCIRGHGQMARRTLLSLALLAIILHVSLELSVVINQSLHSQASVPLTVAAFMQEVLTNPLSVS